MVTTRTVIRPVRRFETRFVPDVCTNSRPLHTLLRFITILLRMIKKKNKKLPNPGNLKHKEATDDVLNDSLNY